MCLISEAPQKLYVRLFSRKLAWLPMAKINYPEISDDIEGLINTLVDASLLKAGKVNDENPITGNNPVI